MITIMEVNKCALKKCELPITSLEFPMDLLELTNKLEPAKLYRNLEKTVVRKVANLNCEHSRGKK